MSNEVYAELFALGQCMPGPTSTQVRRAAAQGACMQPHAACVVCMLHAGSNTMAPSSACRPWHAGPPAAAARCAGHCYACRSCSSPQRHANPRRRPKVSFSIGIIKKGVPGGLLSGALFQYPGAIIMTAVGVLAARYLENPQGWLSGLTAGERGSRR